MKVVTTLIVSGLGLAVILPVTAAAQAQPPAGKAAATVAAAAATAPEVISLADHKDVHTDPTKALTEVLNSNAKKVIIPDLGKPYVVSPILVRNGDKEIVFEPGAVIAAQPGAYKDKMASLIRFENVQNVAIHGNGATLRMNREEYRQPDHERSEHRHGLNIAGSENILVEDLNIEETGGDAIYLGGVIYSRPPYPANTVEVSWEYKDKTIRHHTVPTNRNVTIRRVVTDRNHRQGISLITGENILIEDCLFKNTDGTPPMHGFCIEPALPYHLVKNVVVRNSVAENNSGAGFSAYLRKLRKPYKLNGVLKQPDPVDVLIEDCQVRGSKGAGLVVGAIGDRDDEGIDAKIVFKDCTVEDTERAGIYIYDKSYKTGTVIFDNVRMKNVAKSATGGSASPELTTTASNTRRQPPSAPVVFYLRRQSDLPNHFGGVVFKDCVIEDEKDRPLVDAGAYIGIESIQISDVHGTIKTSQKNPRMNLGEYTSDVTLELIPN